MEDYYKGLTQEGTGLSSPLVKNKRDLLLQEQVVASLWSNFIKELDQSNKGDQTDDFMESFLYMIIWICIPKLKQRGGAKHGTTHQHRLKFYHKMRYGFSFKKLAWVAADPYLSLMF